MTRLRAGRSGVPFRSGARDLALLQNVQIGSGNHHDRQFTAYSMRSGAVSSVERGREVKLNIHLHLAPEVLFCGEGPRSRCYAALRLIVQHCDENDFFHPCNGAPVE